jgi:hypothetical protein
MKAWFIFIRERFPPVAYLSMVTVFTLANLSVVSFFVPGATGNVTTIASAWTVTLFFFFRLRLFDELKDEATDRVINTGRPLARGLLAAGQLKKLAFVLVVIELIVVAGSGKNALMVHAIAVLFSLLMYREFFIGAFLRRRLTLYAVTHTAVSVLLGYSISAQFVNQAFRVFPTQVLAFGIINWALFNLFEFSRKTFSLREELPLRESYSGLYGRTGAFLLSASQSVAAIAMLFLLGGNNFFLLIHVILLAGMFLLSLRYLSGGASAFYRMAWGFYIILFYILVIIQFSCCNNHDSF